MKKILIAALIVGIAAAAVVLYVPMVDGKKLLAE